MRAFVHSCIRAGVSIRRLGSAASQGYAAAAVVSQAKRCVALRRAE